MTARKAPLSLQDRVRLQDVAGQPIGVFDPALTPSVRDVKAWVWEHGGVHPSFQELYTANGQLLPDDSKLSVFAKGSVLTLMQWLQMGVSSGPYALAVRETRTPPASEPRAERRTSRSAPSSAPRRTANTTLLREVYSFDDLGVSEDLLRGIYSYGLEKPSAIQRRAINCVMAGRDCICQAQSGTGKTVAYVIGALARIDATQKQCQVLILAPSRELANQIQKVTLALGDFMRIRCHCCIGGTSVRGDIDRLHGGPQIVVGMPGRIFDMLGKRHLRVKDLQTLILDEGDALCSRTFKDQLYDIFRCLPPDVQVCMVSTTFPPEILDMTTKFMRDSVRIQVRKEELMPSHIQQYYVAIEKEEWKLDTLCDLFEILTRTQTMVFSSTRRKVDFIADNLCKRDFTVSTLHAELDQRERDLVMREFRSGSSRVLLTTDTLARGIDVPAVSCVVNFDLPCSMEEYVHRVGRAGRFGRKGVVINFVTSNDVRTVKDIENYYEFQIQEMPMDIEDCF